MSSCAKCGNLNKPGAKFCKSCGEKLELATTPVEPACPHCSAPLAPNAKFCKQCGTATSAPAAPPTPPLAAAVPQSLAPTDEVVATPAVEPPARPTADTVTVETATGVSTAPQAATSAGIKIAAAVSALTVLVGGGFFVYQHISKPVPAADMHPATPAPVAASPAVSASAPPAEVAASIPVVAEAPPPSPPAAPPEQASKAKAEPAPRPGKPVHAAAGTAARVEHSETSPAPDLNEAMARKVSTLIAKANGYLDNKQYDKAIATAENALELDPRSSAAQAMINRAKTRQMEALRTGSTLE